MDGSVALDRTKITSTEIKQLRAAYLLIREGREAVERELELSPRTLTRWLATESFMAMVEAARGEAFQVTADELSRLGSVAASELEQLITNHSVPPGVRVRAVDVALARIAQYREIGMVSNRLSAIEQAIKEMEA